MYRGTVGQFARLISDGPGRAIFFLLAACWTLLLCSDLLRTAHSYPDYGDLFRWIMQFFEPLLAAEDPDLVAAVFAEYEFPGHGHVLTKVLMLLASQYAHFDFHLLRLFGTAAYLLLLALLLWQARGDMRRFGQRSAGWTLALLLMLLAHPEDDHLWNNLLSFEYSFILFAWLLIVSVYRYLTAGRSLATVLLCTLVATLFADIAFALALGASATLLITAVLSGDCPLRRAAPIFLLLVVTPVLIIAAGAGDNAAAARQDFDVLRFLQWIAAGLGSGLVSASYLLARGLSRPEAYQMCLIVGALLLVGTLLTGLDQLINRRPSNLAIAMIVFGLLSLAGSFATRNSLGDAYVLAPRYIRYSSFPIVGLAWYWLIVRADSWQTLRSKPAIAGPAIAAWILIAGVFVLQLTEYPRRTAHFVRVHESREAALESFAAGDSAIPGELYPILAVWLRDRPDMARRTVRSYLRCRDEPGHCRIGSRHG